MHSRVTQIRTHGYLGAKFRTQIHEDPFPQITWSRKSKTHGSTGTHRYCQWQILTSTHRYTHEYLHQKPKKIINIVQFLLQTTLIDYYATVRLWLSHFHHYALFCIMDDICDRCSITSPTISSSSSESMTGPSSPTPSPLTSVSK